MNDKTRLIAGFLFSFRVIHFNWILSGIEYIRDCNDNPNNLPVIFVNTDKGIFCQICINFI